MFNRFGLNVRFYRHGALRVVWRCDCTKPIFLGAPIHIFSHSNVSIHFISYSNLTQIKTHHMRMQLIFFYFFLWYTN